MMIGTLKTILLSVALVVYGSATFADPATDLAQKTDPFLGPVAHIEDPQGGASGFFTDPTHVVTARHVLEQLRNKFGVYVYDSAGGRHHILGMAPSKDADVAMLEVDNPNTTTALAKVDCRMPRRFEVLVSVGFPLNLQFITSPVMVVGFNDERDLDAVTSVIVAGATAPGMSGGPVYSQDGKVVAVVSSTPMWSDSEHGPMNRSEFTSIVPVIAIAELCMAAKEPPKSDPVETPTPNTPPVEEPKEGNQP